MGTTRAYICMSQGNTEDRSAKQGTGRDCKESNRRQRKGVVGEKKEFGPQGTEQDVTNKTT